MLTSAVIVGYFPENMGWLIFLFWVIALGGPAVTLYLLVFRRRRGDSAN